ncbi:unnamed protein product [Arabis nemorensis]|uniref:Ubiquitin-like protease family profile domain-containing protein n=1 Tax=Arabis nemorensis TaxID=586526 RepID=A0A565CCM0_9BRAS|nr:unnamed protein product [Arabis nemorensis]
MDQRGKSKEVPRNVPSMEKPDLPHRMFATGHELVGIQVTAYHPTGGIRSILNALEQDEVNCSSSSDSEAGDDDDTEDDKESPTTKISLSPGHARNVHVAAEASVDCIITDDGENEIPDSTYVWPEDVQVENMVKLINEESVFHSEMFVGGATKADVIRMRKEEEENNAKAKQRKAGASVEEGNADTDGNGCFDINSCIQQIEVLKSKLDLLEMDITDGLDKEFDQMLSIMKEHISNVGTNLCQKGTSVGGLSCEAAVLHTSKTCVSPNANKVGDNPVPGLGKQADEVDRVINSVMEEIHNNIPDFSTATEDTEGDDIGVADVSLDDGEGGGMDVDCNGEMGTALECGPVVNGIYETLLLCPIPSFSLGLSQGDADCETEVVEPSVPDIGGICRKSKRQKTVALSLVDDYQCDMRIVHQAREAHMSVYGDVVGGDYCQKFGTLEKVTRNFTISVHGVFISAKEILEVAERTKNMPTKMVDVLMHHTRSLHNKQALVSKKVEFLDTKFVSQLSKNYSKFAAAVKKEEFKFSKSLTQMFCQDKANSYGAEQFYFPFNFDKQHWVGVCVGYNSSVVYVLDCNISLRGDAALLKDLNPLAQMFPFLLKQAGRNLGSRECKPFTVERAKGIPQNGIHSDSVVTSILMMQAHAFADLAVCRCITPAVLPMEAQRLAIMLYEENYERL